MTINRTPETVATESRIGRKKATRNRKATKSTVGVRSTAERRGAVDARGEGRGTTGPSRQSDELVALAEEDAELWHGSDKVAYATIDAGGHREHCRLDDETFTDWLAERFHGQAGRVPNGQQIADALRVLKFKARKGACYRPAIRVAWHDGANWFDLGDDKWRAVRIDGNGWSVVDRPPVRFVRTSFTDTLPEPVAGLADSFRLTT